MRPIFRFAFLIGLSVASSAHADSALQYRLNGQSDTQSVLIKEGKVLIPGLDGADHHRDLLYDKGLSEAVLIDHKSQTYVKVNRETIERISRQTEPLQPLIAGLGAQLKNLTPEQRAKWQAMLGGVDLDKLAAASQASAPMHLTKEGQARQVGHFKCTPLSVRRGKDKVAEICLSEAAEIGLAADDYATFRSLLDFAQKVAKKTQGLSSLMGFSIPVVSVQEAPGVPVEIRSSGRQNAEKAQLASVASPSSTSVAMTVPDGYRSQELKLW
jgi:hypothetical protein